MPSWKEISLIVGWKEMNLYLNHVNPVLVTDSTSDPYVFSSLW